MREILSVFDLRFSKNNGLREAVIFFAFFVFEHFFYSSADLMIITLMAAVNSNLKSLFTATPKLFAVEKLSRSREAGEAIRTSGGSK